MKRTILVAAVSLLVVAAVPKAWAVEPYLQIETGVFSRDIVEEDASIAGFTAEGSAVSTRLLATAGLELTPYLAVYVQGGGADLKIDEFNGFDSSFEGAYGAGLRLNLYLSPNRDRLRLFVDGSWLHTSGEDTVLAEFACSAANGCTAGPGYQGEYLPRLLEETIEWDEYTVLLGAGWRYGPFAPYGGVRLSMVDAEDRFRAAPDENFAGGFKFAADVKEQDNFGVFFGSDMALDRLGKTLLNFEVSLLDQYSFRAAVRRAF
jgi:opacity protein-like surface antigen